MDKFDELIIHAKPVAPSHERVLASVAARPVARVGAASRVWRAAALIALAAGVGALAAMLPGYGVGSPAAGDASIEQVTQGLAHRLEVLEGPSPADRIAELNRRLDSVEQARRANVRAALSAAIREASVERKERELERRMERHVAQVRAEYGRQMQDQLAQLKADGLSNDRLEGVRAILEQHGARAEELVRDSYRGGERKLGEKFALLARETEDRLARATGRHQWRDVLGADPAQWAPTSDFEDWSDFDNLADWMRHSSRG
jgi:hypothetical protein